MKTIRTIAMAAAIVAAAGTISAPTAQARGGVALGIGLGLVGAMAAHNIARERAEAANAQHRARMAAYERARAASAARAQRAAEAKAAAERRAAAVAAAKKAAVAKNKQDAATVQVAAAPKAPTRDEQLAAAINSLKTQPIAKASPSTDETPPPAVARIEQKPAEATPAPAAAPKSAGGECKRFVPSAGTTITVPCTE